MFTELKTKEDAVKYFEKKAEEDGTQAIVLYHNQRKTVREVLKELAEKSCRKFIDQDLSVIQDERIGTTIFENEVPTWLKSVFEKEDEDCGFIVYMREFHFANDRVKNDAMGLLVNKEVESMKFPEKTILVLGVLDIDDVTNALSNVDSVRFYADLK